MSSDGKHGAIVTKLDSGQIGEGKFKGSLIQLGSTLGASSGTSPSGGTSQDTLNGNVSGNNSVSIGSKVITSSSSDTLDSDDANKVKRALRTANNNSDITKSTEITEDI